MVVYICSLPIGAKISILAPIVKNSRGEHRKELIRVRKQGWTKIKVDTLYFDATNFLPKLDKTTKHNIDVVLDTITIMEKNDESSILRRIKDGLDLSNGIIFVDLLEFPEGIDSITMRSKTFGKGEQIRFSQKYTCPDTGLTIDSIEPKLFSFNNPFGACPKCDGLGTESYFDPELIIMDSNLTIRGGAIDPWRTDANAKTYLQVIEELGKVYGFDIDTPYYKYSDEIKNLILYGAPEQVEVQQETGLTTLTTKMKFDGIINILLDKFNRNRDEMYRDELSKYQSLKPCSHCNGYRLNEEALSVRVAGVNIGELCQYSIQKLIKFFVDLPDTLKEGEKIIADKIIHEIKDRLLFLTDVGLEYLTLSRESGTLSGGESQRVRLATQIGTGLSGVLYVLDEPSIGLHQSDNRKLIKTLKHLRDLGNTVIVVEHDEETMMEADWLVDIGPGAGIHGGTIVAEGTPQDVINNPNSITGMYLKGKKSIPVPSYRRQFNPQKSIIITGARGHNLKSVNVSFPMGIFCAVTGVSGGGKSTLVLHTLYKALVRILNNTKVAPGPFEKIEGIKNVDKVIQIDQSPIGRTPRSNSCTYVGAFTHIRDIFVNTDEAVNRDYKLNRFSFNVKGGRCENCQGDGSIKIEMHFLPDVYIPCPVCGGKRYNSETLEVEYNGKNIADVLDMTVEEACVFFKDQILIYDKFKALKDVGLGYIKIGQAATTLSGGEAQRIKLAKELSKKDTGNTLYILDEPTTGLHSDDIKKLLCVLHKLVEQGNTIIVIEHNLDVIKTSDWIIDIGPCGGEQGGYVIAEGTPEQVANDPNSLTGKYLKEVLERFKNNQGQS